MSAFGRLKQRVLAVIGKGHNLGNDSVPDNVLIVPRVSQKSVIEDNKESFVTDKFFTLMNYHFEPRWLTKKLFHNKQFVTIHIVTLNGKYYS